MLNKKIANEWISFAEKNLETAILLYKENHYTDVIAVDVQQAIEKALKAVYALYGEKIPRTHSLEILLNYAASRIDFDDIDIVKLIIVSDYYQTERYPGPRYFSPGRDEINTSIGLAKTMVNKVKYHLNQHLQ